MDILSIFSVPIICIELDLDLSIIEKYCLDYRQNNTGRISSNVGGYQSEDLPKQYDPEIESLLQEIEKGNNEFAKAISLDGSLTLDNMWININGNGDSNSIHTHPGGVCSGVFYVKTPENSGNIMFINPAQLMKYSTSLLKYKEYNQFNTTGHWRKAESNVLYIFPSWLEHFVEQNLGKEERISISFNSY